MSKVEKLEFQGIQYLLYYPVDYKEGEKYPTIFHLHGAGSRGYNFENFKDSIILDELEKENTPLSKAICVFPQCHEDNWYCIFDSLVALAKHIYSQPYVDQNRFNLSGISMGGYALYSLAMVVPELFNKALVCCGAGMYWNSGRIKHIKFRIFHGEKDGVVFPEESRRMYARLKEACAPDVELTIYPECDHNCWETTYGNIVNLQWLVE